MFGFLVTCYMNMRNENKNLDRIKWDIIVLLINLGIFLILVFSPGKLRNSFWKFRSNGLHACIEKVYKVLKNIRCRGPSLNNFENFPDSTKSSVTTVFQEIRKLPWNFSVQFFHRLNLRGAFWIFQKEINFKLWNGAIESFTFSFHPDDIIFYSLLFFYFLCLGSCFFMYKAALYMKLRIKNLNSTNQTSTIFIECQVYSVFSVYIIIGLSYLYLNIYLYMYI